MGKKIEIFGYFEYENGEKVTFDKEVDVEKVIVKAVITSILFTQGINGGVAHAGSVTDSLQPLIDILKDLAEPVSYGFMVKGFMKIMAGEENEGMKTIKGAIGGFIGIQWIPYIFGIIKGIKF